MLFLEEEAETLKAMMCFSFLLFCKATSPGGGKSKRRTPRLSRRGVKHLSPGAEAAAGHRRGRAVAHRAPPGAGERRGAASERRATAGEPRFWFRVGGGWGGGWGGARVKVHFAGHLCLPLVGVEALRVGILPFQTTKERVPRRFSLVPTASEGSGTGWRHHKGAFLEGLRCSWIMFLVFFFFFFWFFGSVRFYWGSAKNKVLCYHTKSRDAWIQLEKGEVPRF